MEVSPFFCLLMLELQEPPLLFEVFGFVFWDKGPLCNLGWSKAPFIAKAGFELRMFLLQPSGYWDCKMPVQNSFPSMVSWACVRVAHCGGSPWLNKKFPPVWEGKEEKGLSQYPPQHTLSGLRPFSLHTTERVCHLPVRSYWRPGFHHKAFRNIQDWNYSCHIHYFLVYFGSVCLSLIEDSQGTIQVGTLWVFASQAALSFEMLLILFYVVFLLGICQLERG